LTIFGFWNQSTTFIVRSPKQAIQRPKTHNGLRFNKVDSWRTIFTIFPSRQRCLQINNYLRNFIHMLIFYWLHSSEKCLSQVLALGPCANCKLIRFIIQLDFWKIVAADLNFCFFLNLHWIKIKNFYALSYDVNCRRFLKFIFKWERQLILSFSVGNPQQTTNWE